MFPRLVAFVVWALVAASGVFWLLRLNAVGPSMPQAAVAAPQALTTRAELSRVLGSTPVVSSPVTAVPELNARFVLSGVMAPKSGLTGAGAKVGSGLALIAIDGQPPKPYAVGARVDGDLRLLSVDLRSASIGPEGGAALVTLTLPELPPATTGSLPPPPEVMVPANVSLPMRMIQPEQAR